MLAIVNVTKEAQPLDDYEIRINQRVIGTFQHKRSYQGAAQCLRDAANALDKARLAESAELLEALLPTFKRMQNT